DGTCGPDALAAVCHPFYLRDFISTAIAVYWRPESMGTSSAAKHGRRDMANQREHLPVWVRVGLWGLSTRTSVLAFVWLSIVLAVASVVAGFWRPILFAGVSF